jgi:peptide/nickel transport system substrate-binding protein
MRRMAMKSNVKAALLSVLIAVIVLGLQACGPAATPQPTTSPELPQEEQFTAEPTAVQVERTQEAEPVVLRVGGVDDIDCWNPFACSEIYEFEPPVYEGLYSRGRNLACDGEPQLAKSMEVSEDGLTWTITLQEGVTFSDGTQLNAQTVVDYFEWMASGEDLRYWYYETTYMHSIEVVDDLTLRLTTEYPILSFPNYGALWNVILPPHIWSDLGGDEVYTFDPDPPIGTGPYVVSEREPGEYIIYDAREDYYLGKPAVDRMVYQLYANWDTLIQALIAGEIDLTMNGLPTIYYDALAQAEDVSILELPPGPMIFLAFNLYQGGKKHPAIKDIRIRQAIDYAIDKQKVVDVSLLGHGTTCPTSWACGAANRAQINPDLVETPYDPDMAIQILEDAGYRDTDGDGIRETPEGLPLNFRVFYTESDPVQISVSQFLDEWLQAVGIDTEIVAMEVGTLFDTVGGERDYDIVLTSFEADTDVTSMDFYYSCWSADAGAGSYNMAGYCNPDLDDLVFQMITAPTEEAFTVASNAAQLILNQDLPWLIIAGQNQMQGYRTNKFEFDTEVCVMMNCMWDYPQIINIRPK